MINVYRASNELLEKKSEVGKEKREKILRKWCKENFINSRSLRHARDIHRLDTHPYLICWTFSFSHTIDTLLLDKDPGHLSKAPIHLINWSLVILVLFFLGKLYASLN